MFTFLVLMIKFFNCVSLYRNPHRSHSAIAFLPDENLFGMVNQRTVDAEQT